MANNVFQCLNLPENGSCMALGPVTITEDGGIKTTKTGKSWRPLKVKDASGEAKMNLWGDCAQQQLQVGSVVTFKGKISKNVYNDVASITSENAVAVREGQQGHQNAPGSTGGAPAASMKKLIDYGLQCVDYARKKGVTEGELLASVFGSAMYGFKEGRPLFTAEEAAAARPAPPPPQDLPEQEWSFESDDNPF